MPKKQSVEKEAKEVKEIKEVTEIDNAVTKETVKQDMIELAHWYATRLKQRDVSETVIPYVIQMYNAIDN